MCETHTRTVKYGVKVELLMKISLRLIAAVIAAAVSVSCLCTTAFAAEKTTPSGVEFSELPEEIEKLTENRTFASFSTAVFTPEEIVYEDAFGYADKENGIEADSDTVYEWGSTSKTLIWVSAMQLYEQGKLDLEADVRTYLPDGFFKKLKYDDPITMLDLMNHTGGWQESLYTIQVKDESKIVSLEESLKYSEPVQIFRPGEVVAYSNWGAALAGYVVECISGENYGDYVHEHIFDKIGMEHTSISPDHRDNPWVREQRDKLISYAASPDDTLSSLGTNMAFINLYPAGAATGTIDDLAKYGQALIQDDSPLFEKKETKDLMFSTTGYLGESDIPINFHGFWATMLGVTTCGHDGATDACTTSFMFDLDSKIGAAVLTNQQGERYFCSEIVKLVFGKTKDNPLLNKTYDITDRSDISAVYTTSRTHFRGISSIFSLGSFNPVTEISEDKYSILGIVSLDRIGNGLYRLDQAGQSALVSSKTLSDGTKVLSVDTGDLIEYKTAYAKLAILIVNAVMAIAAIITAAQGARVLSIAAIAVLSTVMTAYMGLTHWQAAIFGIAEILFFIAFIAAAVISAVSLFSEKENKTKPVKYVLNIISNGLSAAFIIVFELYCFWL